MSPTVASGPLRIPPPSSIFAPVLPLASLLFRVPSSLLLHSNCLRLSCPPTPPLPPLPCVSFSLSFRAFPFDLKPSSLPPVAFGIPPLPTCPGPDACVANSAARDRDLLTASRAALKAMMGGADPDQEGRSAESAEHMMYPQYT